MQRRMPCISAISVPIPVDSHLSFLKPRAVGRGARVFPLPGHAAGRAETESRRRSCLSHGGSGFWPRRRPLTPGTHASATEPPDLG